MEKVTISVDIGSSGIRCCAFDLKGRLVAFTRHSYKIYYTADGGAEQNAEDWKDGLLDGLRELYIRIRDNFVVSGIAMTGQCPTWLPVDRDMKPVSYAMIYQDNRARTEADELAATVGRTYIHQHSGNDALAFFILPKIMWQMKNRPEDFARSYKALQPIDYLEYILTGELATGRPNAAGTLAYDSITGSWDENLLKRLGISPDLFPGRICESTDIVGETTSEISEKTGIPAHTRVIYGGPDSQCCCYGAGAESEDILSNMAGTSTCLNSIRKDINPDLRVANYPHVIPGMWCEETGLNSTGASLAKMSEILFGKEKAYDEMVSLLSESSPGSNGLIFLPYLTDGERDDATVQGGFYRMNMSVCRGDFVRSVMEGVAFAEKERASYMRKNSRQYSKMVISGGGCRIDAWNQIRADVMDLPVDVLTDYDAAEAGAAAIAAVGCGEYQDLNEAIAAYQRTIRTFYPQDVAVDQYREYYEKFLECENHKEDMST